jgi:hypothetical protein
MLARPLAQTSMPILRIGLNCDVPQKNFGRKDYSQMKNINTKGRKFLRDCSFVRREQE